MIGKTHEDWSIVRASVTNGSDKEMLYVDPESGAIISFGPGETRIVNVKMNHTPSPHLRIP